MPDYRPALAEFRALAQPVLFLPERITDAQESLELTG